ncbi:hypothetical protein BH20ACT23_BH20ACT23_03270 [soil metagenome]
MISPTGLVIPQTPVARLRGALRDGWTVAWRDLSYWAHQPGQIVASLICPIVFILLFGYVFGSGMIVSRRRQLHRLSDGWSIRADHGVRHR